MDKMVQRNGKSGKKGEIKDFDFAFSRNYLAGEPAAGAASLSSEIGNLQLPAVTFDTDATIVDANAGAEKMLKSGDLALMGACFSCYVIPEDVATFYAHLRDCRRQSSAPVVTTIRLNGPEKRFKVDLLSVPLRGSAVLFRTFLINVTSRETAISFDSLPELVMDLLETPLLIINSRLEVVRANRAFQRVFRVSMEEIRETSLFSLPGTNWLSAGFRQFLVECLETRIPGEPLLLDAGLQKGKVRLIFSLTVRRVHDPARGTSALVLHFQNVTSRIEADMAREQSMRELQSVTEESEERVIERTRQLQEANLRLQQLSAALVEVQELERRHLGRELHDQIGQELTSLNFLLNELARGSKTGQMKKLLDAQKAVGALMRQVRQLSVELRPTVLDDLGLKAAVRWHTKQIQARTGLRIDFKARGFQEKRLARHLRITLFRLIQESLNNVLKHSGATVATIDLAMRKSGVKIVIRDNGHGFSREKPRRVNGIGLIGMQERVELIGGKFEIQSMPGKGTKTMATMPLETKIRSHGNALIAS